jgi:non-heme chloroperoxidase
VPEVPIAQDRRQPRRAVRVEIEGRGHSLVTDSGWQDVADAALDFLGRHDADTATR